MGLSNKYQIALSVLISIKNQLNIVVIGANDGKTNDPIYDFNMTRSGATRVLLIEPNKMLLPYLQKNYSSHPSHQIANCAIGEEGILSLYAIKEKVWDNFQPDYAKGWPPYRAATGLTSAIRSHLEKALIKENLDPDSSIDVLNIPARQLKTLLEELKWPISIDVLQIDAEGYDDVVIYNSDLSYIKPGIIYFESHNMSEEKGKSLERYLSSKGYRTYKVRGDSLAVAGHMNMTCILLNLIMPIHSGMELLLRFKKRGTTAIRGCIRMHNQKHR